MDCFSAQVITQREGLFVTVPQLSFECSSEVNNKSNNRHNRRCREWSRLARTLLVNNVARSSLLASGESSLIGDHSHCDLTNDKRKIALLICHCQYYDNVQVASPNIKCLNNIYYISSVLFAA